MEKLFGTDGIRGRAGEFPLDENTIEIVGASLARHLAEKRGGKPARILTGRDTRESGAAIERAFSAGASRAGALCESAGVITTPGVAYLAKKFDFAAGVVVSASHNPFEDNGVKIFSPTGKKIDEATEAEIERDIFEGSKHKVQNSKLSDEAGIFAVDSSKTDAMQNAYLDYLAGEFKTLRLDGYKMVVDCANGAACDYAPKLFERFGAQVISINDAPDGRNINENCGSLHLENLQKRIAEEDADFGVAFDGDADRALFVDERGNLVDGDATLWIMARHLEKHARLKNKTVVATVMSNLGLELALERENVKLARASVGDKYVLQELLKTGASVGGEQSGHIIFPDRSFVGDGLMTTLSLLEAVRESGKSLSQMTEGFERLPQILVNVKVGKKVPFESVAEITDAAREVETKLGAKGRLLLRYSGTENLARVMIEGENQAQIEKQAHALAAIIKSSLN
jgi:phosphoglucosamine mutase